MKLLKINFLFALLGILVVFSSCKKDDDEEVEIDYQWLIGGPQNVRTGAIEEYRNTPEPDKTYIWTLNGEPIEDENGVVTIHFIRSGDYTLRVSDLLEKESGEIDISVTADILQFIKQSATLNETDPIIVPINLTGPAIYGIKVKIKVPKQDDVYQILGYRLDTDIPNEDGYQNWEVERINDEEFYVTIPEGSTSADLLLEPQIINQRREDRQIDVELLGLEIIDPAPDSEPTVVLTDEPAFTKTTYIIKDNIKTIGFSNATEEVTAEDVNDNNEYMLHVQLDKQADRDVLVNYTISGDHVMDDLTGEFTFVGKEEEPADDSGVEIEVVRTSFFIPVKLDDQAFTDGGTVIVDITKTTEDQKVDEGTMSATLTLNP
ncbi:hypothetical protein [Xanthovirga aplysinae]|uniref:hypothetical protein n=1 Tax=Xanthovirga aplysinae TaxID=2529853 RepID=UPI0012BCBB7B|nr:hypothetical protein [Xanthovirga aplysinae]MTI31037.1 hypothetical protein [Xanthovirga aplysinae]